ASSRLPARSARRRAFVGRPTSVPAQFGTVGGETRMIRSFGTLVAAALAAALATPAASHAAEHYTPVTKQRLLHPEPRNWLLYRGNYAGWGFSPLAQIDVKNVKHLKLAWSSATGMNEGHEAPPIVNDGFMFVTTPNNQVIAFEAKSGKELWRYKKTI